MSKVLLLLSFVFLCLTNSAVQGQVTSYSIRNLSNENIAVATAGLRYDLPANYDSQPIARGCDANCHVSTGWFTIKPNETKTFSAKQSLGLCLRIESSGNEVLPNGTNEFQIFPATNERFQVCNTSNKDVVRLLTGHGSYVPGSHDTKVWYKNCTNMKRGGSLPKGWKNSRFFVVPHSDTPQSMDVLPTNN